MLVLGSAGEVAAGGWPSYYDRYRFLLAPPAVWNDGLVGFAQPATLAFLARPEAQFHWSTPSGRVSGFEDWGFYGGVPHFGFAVQARNTSGVSEEDYALSLGLGSREFSLGTQYGFGGGGAAPAPWLALGAVWRPDSRWSVSATGRYNLEGPEYEWTAEVGVRPLGGRRLTLFGDLAWAREAALADVPWSAGAAVGVVPGVDLVGRYFESGAVTLALAVNLGRTGLSGQSHLNDGDFSYQSWSVRMGGLKPGLATGKAATGRNYVALHPKGRVRYLKYRLFDQGGTRFFDLLSDIRSAGRDHRVAVIALNLSGVQLLPEHAWEVRAALETARGQGKTVVVFIDHVGMTGYHLASVADCVVMDPYGTLLLPGYALHKTYLRGSLEKLGLAFDEWRHYRYKSAAEVLVLDSMSEADREQSQAFVDDWYEQTARDVSRSRGLSREAFDRLIDEGMLFTSDSARAAGLVDTLARWSDLDAVIRKITGRKLRALSAGALLDRALDQDEWGEPPTIAVVYGLGVCDMERGIRARQLERVFRRLARDRRVKAVVFRVDSPGGDPLASDLVAEAVRACSERKPVIVSQGQVAASGGYWLSMAADSILAGPSTVTGSIGVIGGWLYDQGFSSKLGMTSDVVQRGRHADYDAGVQLPLLGLRIPRRPLSDSETARVQVVTADLYRRFTAAVAGYRRLSADSVNRIAEGRIYSGPDAETLGLVDGIGGLLLALDWASARAGLPAGTRTQIVEYPSRAGWFVWPWSAPSALDAMPDPEWEATLRLLAAFNGQALTLLLPGAYPDDD
jgi:protease-4